MKAPSNSEPTATLKPSARLPLSTLLSQVLVAFTIEFDNEFEHQMPHRITNSPGSAAGPAARTGPWLVSMVMFLNLMQYVREEGITVGELQALARTARLSLAGMERWGYIVIESVPANSRLKAPRPEWVVRPTAKGRLAQGVWRPLFGVIEKRWQARFGEELIDRLRGSLSELASKLDVTLPDYLPVLGFGLAAAVFPQKGPGPATGGGSHLPSSLLPVLLSNALLALTVEFERESDLSLAISANVIRLLGEKAVPIRDLPRLSGVSKEAIKMALGFLNTRRHIVVEPDPLASRTKLVRLTPKGLTARDAYLNRLKVIEERWGEQFGEDDIRSLRELLEPLVGEPTEQMSHLFQGLKPYPEGWRASVPRPETLPHHPMVLHRGGFPDGS